MLSTHSSVRRTWFRLWAALAVLILTWSAGDRLADRLISGGPADATVSAQDDAEAVQLARTPGALRRGDGS
jgi:hypothetical protein